ncbi:putative ribonuclease H-like domain-containing protein [Tanacetum coccineum]
MRSISKATVKGFSVQTQKLHKGQDRSKSSDSIEIHGAVVSTEDVNRNSLDLYLLLVSSFLKCVGPSQKWTVPDFVRMKRYTKKLGRKLQFDAKEPVGFDKTKVECYNCHKTRQFARECRTKGNQDGRRRDAWNSGNKENGIRSGKQEDFEALVTIDGEVSDTKVQSCSNECVASYNKLKKLYDEQRAQLSDASIEIQAYTQALKKVKAQLVAHQQGQLWYEQKIKFMKIDLDDKTDVLTYHKKLLADAEKEKEDLKAKVEIWHNSSKILAEGMHVSQPSESETQTSDFDTCESNISVETSEFVTETVVNEPKVVSQPKVWSDAPIIEEYESDSEDEHVSQPTKEQEQPSFASTNKQVKTPKEIVKNQFTHSKNPTVDKKGLGYGFTARTCFVYGSLSNLIRDCDFHEKRMAKQAELNNSMRMKSSQREIRPIWNNVQRVNHKNQFVPTAVLTRTGKIPVNTARASGTNNVSTARHDFNRQAVPTNAAMKVNTVKPIVNRVRPANVFYKTHSPFSRIYPHRALKHKGIIDSGCSRHMTGNKAYLAAYQDFNGGPVAFGGSKGYITGKGKIKTGKLDFEDVCFVKELQHFNALFCVTDKDFIEFCGSKGIKREYSNARTPQQNGVAERKNKTLIEAARTMLTDSFLPNTFWVEAVSTACYVLNRKIKLTKTSRTTEAKHNAGTKDNIDAGDSEKEDKSAQDYFVLPIWSFYSSTVKRSTEKDAGETLNTHHDLKTDENLVDKEDQVFLDELERLKRQEKDANDAAEALRKDTHSPYNVPSFSDPTNPDQDDSEIPALEDIYHNPTDDLPYGKKAIGTKWVYRNKKDERGVVVKNKARLVAQGHRQEEGIDYDEVFALVARIEAIRIFLAFASYMGFIVYQMDVKSTFLYGKIDEEVYVSQPPGFIDPKYPQKVYKVVKALYGLHQAPRACVKTASTPIETQKPLVKDEEASDVDVTPKTSHLSAVKRIFRYLKANQNWAFGEHISWQCKKHTIVATSTTEAEYVAVNCYGQNPVHHSKTKHIAIRHHFIRDAYEKKLIQVLKIHTDDNVADLLTKAFDVSRFQFLVVTIGDQSISDIKSLGRDKDGIEVLLLPNLFIFLLAQVSTDSAKLVPLGKDSTAIEMLKKIPPRHLECKEEVCNGKHFSGKVTPLFASMLVQSTKDEGATLERPSEPQPTPSPPHPSEANIKPQSDPSPRPSSTPHIPDSILEVTDQAKEIKHLKAQSLDEECILEAKIGGKEILEVKLDAKGVCTDDRTKARSATPITLTTTPTMFRDDETIAQVLLNMSQAKAVLREKEKGVELKDIDPKDKGKKKIEEEDESDTESEDIPEAEKKFKQLARDEEMARKMEADRLLALRLQDGEREQFTVEERAKFLHDTIAAQRRFLAEQRAIAIRNKPPTRTPLRNQMMTYLKHVGNKKHSDIKEAKLLKK